VPPIEKLLHNNKAWAADRVQRDPGFFTRLARLQAPEFLWIGCSDSRVRHVVVCGHYNCGGIRAAMEGQSPRLLMVNKWLKHIKDLYVTNRARFESGLGDEEAYHRLVELNVTQQIFNIAHTSIIQEAWAMRQSPTLHGCVYGIDDGRIKEIIRLDATHAIDPVYKYAFPPESLT